MGGSGGTMGEGRCCLLQQLLLLLQLMQLLLLSAPPPPSAHACKKPPPTPAAPELSFPSDTFSPPLHLPPLLQAIMSSKFWADACATAANRPLQVLNDTAYASCGVTVSWGCRC